MKLTLPFPPSANAIWRNVLVRGQPRTLLSAEGRAYKAAVARICRKAGLTPLDGEVSLTAHVYRPALRGDLGNRLKALEDALNGYAWHDDKQVARIHLERHLDRERPRVEVEVLPLGERAPVEVEQVKAALESFRAEVGRVTSLSPESRQKVAGRSPAAKLKRLARPNVRPALAPCGHPEHVPCPRSCSSRGAR